VGQARGVRALVVDVATELGFKGVMAGPLVRSSYRAGRLWAQAMARWGRPVPEHLAHLAEAAGAPARQEAVAVVAAFAERSGAPVS
jgi:lipoic acid synthetase